MCEVVFGQLQSRQKELSFYELNKFNWQIFQILVFQEQVVEPVWQAFSPFKQAVPEIIWESINTAYESIQTRKTIFHLRQCELAGLFQDQGISVLFETDFSKPKVVDLISTKRMALYVSKKEFEDVYKILISKGYEGRFKFHRKFRKPFNTKWEETLADIKIKNLNIILRHSPSFSRHWQSQKKVIGGSTQLNYLSSPDHLEAALEWLTLDHKFLRA